MKIIFKFIIQVSILQNLVALKTATLISTVFNTKSHHQVSRPKYSVNERLNVITLGQGETDYIS